MSITASGQQDLSRLERAWGESSPRPVEYGALVLAHDALSGGFWCEVRLFGLGFGVRCAVFLRWILVHGAPFLGWILVRGMWCADLHGASFLGSILVRGAPFLGSILVAVRFWGRFRCTVCFFGIVFGVWRAVFGLDFGARCVVRRFWGGFRCTVRLFGFDFGALPFLGSILVRGALMLGSITASGQQGESSPRPVKYGPWSWRMIPFWVDFGARCAFFGLSFGVRCAVFGLDFGARCAVFGLDFGARCVVRRFWGRFRCTVRRFWAQFWCAVRRFWARFWCAVCGAPISVHGAPFWARKIGEDRGGIEPETCRIWGLGPGAWCPFGWILVRGAPFRVGFWCGVRRFCGGFWCTVRRFWAGFWCAVRRFWAGFWCAVCRALILGPISVHGASFLGSILVRGAPFLGSILVRGVWCADFGADFGARCAFFGSFLVCGAPFLGSILVHGVWCADFGADFVARCAFLGSILAPCLFGIDFGIDFGAWCADVGVDHSQRATRSIKTWTFCFLALCWAPLSWPQNVVTTLFKTIASFLHA